MSDPKLHHYVPQFYLRRFCNAMWLKAGMFSDGTYLVYPLAPDIVMYCYPPEEPWLNVASFDSCVSQVSFTADMVESENTAQVFMASRFVFQVGTTLLWQGILTQQSAQMSTLLSGSRASGLHPVRTSSRNGEGPRGRDSRPSSVQPWLRGYPATPARVCGSKARAERSRPRRRCVSHHPTPKRQPKGATACLRGASLRAA